MWRNLIQRGCLPEQLTRVVPSERLHLRERGGPGRNGARLIQDQGFAARERLERPAALHDDASPRGPRDSRDNRHWRRQYQRTRRRHDQNRQRPYRVPRYQPRQPGYRQGQRQEENRIAVGQAD